jgi:hypothetical protein
MKSICLRLFGLEMDQLECINAEFENGSVGINSIEKLTSNWQATGS